MYCLCDLLKSPIRISIHRKSCVCMYTLYCGRVYLLVRWK